MSLCFTSPPGVVLEMLPRGGGVCLSSQISLRSGVIREGQTEPFVHLLCEEHQPQRDTLTVLVAEGGVVLFVDLRVRKII